MCIFGRESDDVRRFLPIRAPSTEHNIARNTKGRAQRTRPLHSIYIKPLVFLNLGDSTHRALLEAVATSDASILVHDLEHAIDNLDNLLRASVDADSATDAGIFINNGTGHSWPPFLYDPPWRLGSSLALHLLGTQDTT